MLSKGLILLACISMIYCVELEKYTRVDGKWKIAETQLQQGINKNLTKGTLKIAVVGDSRAAGSDVHKNVTGESWPKQLNQFFKSKGWDDKIDLIDFSKGRVTMTDPHPNQFYSSIFHNHDEILEKRESWEQQFIQLPHYDMLIQAQPNIIIIDLGALDFWNYVEPEEFRNQTELLIRKLQTKILPTPTIYLANIQPWRFKTTEQDVNKMDRDHQIISESTTFTKDHKWVSTESAFDPIIEQLASEMQFHVVDMYHIMGGNDHEKLEKVYHEVYPNDGTGKHEYDWRHFGYNTMYRTYKSVLLQDPLFQKAVNI